MKKLHLLFALAFLTVYNCEPSNNFTLKGHIKDLKKGTLYLEKISDSITAVVDSVEIKNESELILKANLVEPQMMQLRLDKKDHQNHEVLFFAEPGEYSFTSRLKDFEFGIQIQGGKQNKLYENYKETILQFRDKNLDLIKAHLSNRDSFNATQLESQQLMLTKRKHLYTLNFANNNPDMELSAYMLDRISQNIHPTFLDSIFRTLNPKIQTSIYGKKVESYLSKIQL